MKTKTELRLQEIARLSQLLDDLDKDMDEALRRELDPNAYMAYKRISDDYEAIRAQTIDLIEGLKDQVRPIVLRTGHSFSAEFGQRKVTASLNKRTYPDKESVFSALKKHPELEDEIIIKNSEYVRFI